MSRLLGPNSCTRTSTSARLCVKAGEDTREDAAPAASVACRNSRRSRSKDGMGALREVPLAKLLSKGDATAAHLGTGFSTLSNRLPGHVNSCSCDAAQGDAACRASQWRSPFRPLVKFHAVGALLLA